ncbi:YCII-related protein [Kribbella flavida DSM 17836]|uniref:YCII-related protein n=1 Tax=Kribbella flavida (strain DSM 17836 / JCM 10339 / NBRC 14399) TaxID=479435 RepID=D2Q3G9_KRIFD|nr:YciI family protein [Kribbella flavida]ADB34092.1 YCII-related protein [Kribbella flavida DSM 17836]
MKYLLMICGDESAEAHALDGCGGWSEEMQARGVVEGGAGLRPPREATTVRVRDDELLLTDGPFAETKEQIGGFVLIDCADLDEAIEIAAKHPAAAYGTIEIRPLLAGPPEAAGL